MRNKKKNRYMLLLILLLGITLGYAAISTTLKIVGDATVTKQTWNVYWGVPTVTEGSVSMTAPTRGADQDEPANTKLTWSVTLNLPGDFYEFEVDAVNEGTIDAMITGIEPTVTPALPEYIKYEVKYADGIEPALNHLLPKGTKSGSTITPTTERYKVRVYYDETVATRDTINNMTGDTTYTFDLDLTYGQATSDAIPKPTFRLPSGKTVDTLSLGDELCVQDQCFNFIKYDGNDVVMLAKYNLKVGGIYEFDSSTYTTTLIGEYTNGDEGYGLQSSEAKGYEQNASTINGIVEFASTNYWWDNNTDNLKTEYDRTSLIGIYDASNYSGAPGENNYSIAYYVEQYKTKLINDYHATIKDARLLTYQEATDSSIGCYFNDYVNNMCPTTGASSFIANTSFWLGTPVDHDFIWIIMSPDDFSFDYYYNKTFGVRPVIVVEKSNL